LLVRPQDGRLMQCLNMQRGGEREELDLGEEDEVALNGEREQRKACV